MKKILLSFFIGVMLIACNQKTVSVREVWTKEQANEWYKQWGWLRGCDFIPSTAINQMEMWQADTFDPVTIDRELGWAEEIGMNCMRVYLHHLVWETDKEGFKKRINEYLTIADKHHISTIFVFLDDCWNPVYQAGKQPEPQPGVHNSGWARDPGDLYYKGDTAVILPILESYVKDLQSKFSFRIGHSTDIATMHRYIYVLQSFFILLVFHHTNNRKIISGISLRPHRIATKQQTN